jgi:membrane protease YdiL (CAAX protease family)
VRRVVADIKSALLWRPSGAAASPLLWLLLALITIAEVLVARGGWQLGLILHITLLTALILIGALGSLGSSRTLIIALTLAPLIRILSLTLPFERIPPIAWYAVVAIPLLIVTWIVTRETGLSAREVGLRVNRLGPELLVAMGGISIGWVEYWILRPAPLAPSGSWPLLLVAALVLMIATGFTEELIFRGLLQTLAQRTLGLVGLVYVALLFTVMHAGNNSALDLLFVGAVGLFFGLLRLWGGSILGVTIAHGLANITLFLLMPNLTPEGEPALINYLPWVVAGSVLLVALGTALLYRTRPARLGRVALRKGVETTESPVTTA